MSDNDHDTKAKLLDSKQKELKRAGDDAQADFQQDMQQTFGAVAGKFAQTLDAYAVEHGFSVVLDNGNQQLPVVIYNNPSVDISKPVIEAYNVKSGIPAPEHPAAAAPGARGTTPARTPAAPKATPTAH
jgi:outer membrane protein